MTVSLRVRLLTGIVVGMVLLLAVFCTLVGTIVRHRLVDQFDRALLSSATMLAGAVETEAPEAVNEDAQNRIYEDDRERLEFDFNLGLTPEFQRPSGGAYYQLWRHDGTAILRSPSLGERDLPYFATASVTHVAQKTVLPDGQPGRVIGYRFTPRSEQPDHVAGKPLILVVGRDATDLYDFLGFLRWLLVNCALVVVVLSALVAWRVTQTALRPVHALAAEIESVDERALGASFVPQAYPAELTPICERLNALLTRIRDSFERERQFNADVAHELRTPLAGLQSVIEVSLARPRQTSDYARTLQDCLTIVQTMHGLVDALLTLSRLDADRAAITRRPVALKTLIDEQWRLLADRAHDRGLTFENQLGAGLACVSSKDHLGMIAANVLDNAVAYANEQGRVWVTGEQSRGAIVLSFSNTGCRLNGDEIRKVFDCFWRADAARTHTGAHCGIGLAVVRKLAQALGAQVHAMIEPGDVFVLRVELPRAHRPAEADT